MDDATNASSETKRPFLEYLATQIFEGRVNQLNYFAVRPAADGSINWGSAQPSHLDLLARLRAVVPFRLVLTVAGGANQFVPVLATKEKRLFFLENLKKIVAKWGLDGLDFDWEFPRNAEDLKSYVELLQKAREVLGPELLLSVAVAREQLLSKDLFHAVNYVNLMAYDFSGKHATYESADEMVSYLVGRFQIPAEKLVLGIPLYARIYSLNNRNYRRAMAYYHLVQQYSPSPQETEVDGYYFNNYDIVRQKVALARKEQLSGIMFWELGQDLYDQRSILRTVLP